MDPTTPSAGRWMQADRGAFGPGCQHPPGRPGRLDESARRLAHEEYAVARLLAAEGHDVRSVRESRGGGRRPDLEVCGGTVEVKSWDPLDVRNGRVPTPRSVLNKLLDGGGQSPAVALYAEGRGATPATFRRGLALYAAHPKASKVTSVRVIGDGFDLSWSRIPPPGPDQAPDRRSRPGPDRPLPSARQPAAEPRPPAAEPRQPAAERGQPAQHPEPGRSARYPGRGAGHSGRAGRERPTPGREGRGIGL